ncbi:MAG: hypothetical protein JO105_11310 [Hyphomicrobiales bacterium]|nr:hypothetical protein [Hyphomicrobiales bacterium]
MTTDSSFQAQAARVLYYVRGAKPLDVANRSLQAVGATAIIDADMAFASGKIDEANFDYSVGVATAEWLIKSGAVTSGPDDYEFRWRNPTHNDDSITLGLIHDPFQPVTGVSRAIYEALTGINLITGQTLSDHEQGFAVFVMLKLSAIDRVRGFEIARKLISISKVPNITDKIIQATMSFYKHIGKRYRYAGSIVGFSPWLLRSNFIAPSIEMLMKAESGPFQRAQALGADYSRMPFNHGIRPEAFEIKNSFVFNVWLNEQGIQSHDIGMAFVGEGASQSFDPHGKSVVIYRSTDGLRVYREVKPYGSTLEVFAPVSSGRKAPLSVAHLEEQPLDEFHLR